jgi:hypothetical protein
LNNNIVIGFNKILSGDCDQVMKYFFNSETSINKLEGVINNNNELIDTRILLENINLSSDLDSINYLLFIPD